MIRDGYVRAFLLSIGVLCGYFLQYQPPVTYVTVHIVIPAQEIRPPNFSDREISCLANVIYNESRNQGTAGQVAVGAVAINRTISGKWKSHDLCKVVKRPKQFAARKPHPSNYIDRMALQKAEQIAIYTVNNYHRIDAELRTYLYFNSGKARSNVSQTIENHNFYRDYS